MQVAGPIEATLVTDQVFEAIRDSIMSGQITPGTRLRLRGLAAELGTSPMPVRDALARLEQVGLVRRTPHRGAVVADLALGELVQVYATRLVLEVAATRAGSGGLRPEAAARMRAEHEKMEAAVDAGQLVEAMDRDEALLTALYASGDNQVMIELIHDLWRRCRPYKIAGIRRSVELGDRKVWSFQARLIEAAAAHDVETATQVTHESLSYAVDRLRELIATEHAST